jgi:Zn finger protein HypA/HybF involved in hydrogenase expression
MYETEQNRCMGLFATLKETLAASTSTTGRNDRESAGAYWCHDCSERVLDLNVDVEGEESPTCPACGDEMTFERSTSSTGCAC